jgi:hypothetical protein
MTWATRDQPGKDKATCPLADHEMLALGMVPAIPGRIESGAYGCSPGCRNLISPNAAGEQ